MNLLHFRPSSFYMIKIKHWNGINGILLYIKSKEKHLNIHVTTLGIVVRLILFQFYYSFYYWSKYYIHDSSLNPNVLDTNQAVIKMNY